MIPVPVPVPVPVTAAPPASGSAANQLPPPAEATAVRRRWFRRKRIVIPLAFLLFAIAVGGFAGWRVYDSFATINQVSTPPPVVSGSSLGGDSNVEIDTGPALAAVQTYEASKRDSNALGAANPTDPANEIAAVITPTAEPDVTSEPTDTTDKIPAVVTPTLTSEPDAIGAADESARETPVATTDSSAQPTVTVEPTGDEPTVADNPQEDATEAPDEIPTQAPVLAGPTTAPLPEFGEDTLNILLMGVDAQSGESIDVGVRPDALAVMHLDRTTGACRMLAIPRDTRVELPGYGLSKINHALAVGGVPYEMQVVEQYLDIELDHYGLIDFGGVIKIVDKVGGVEVDNPAAFSSIGIEFPAGRQILDGEAALAYARFRSDDQGDFGRIGRQQEVLRGVLKKVSPGDLVGMIPEMLPLLEDHFRTDLSPLDLADLARTYGQTCTYETLETNSLDGTTGTFYDPLIKLDLSYVLIDEAELKRQREWLLGE